MVAMNNIAMFRQLKAGIMTVTPEIASEWLWRNEGNREISNNLVTKYASDIAEGHFTLNPDAIAINERGNLCNGQHRLSAIVRSGVPADCFVVLDFPVTKEDFLNFDSGKNRTIRDRVYLSGHDIPKCVIDFAGLYLRLKYNNHLSTASQRLDFIDANATHIEWMMKVARLNGRGNTRFPMLFMVALMDAHLCGAKDKAIEAFIRAYVYNEVEDMPEYYPRHAIELRQSRIAHRPDKNSINVAKSRFNAFENKLQKCYVRDNLYQAELLPLGNR